MTTYASEHLAWQQRVGKETVASNNFYSKTTTNFFPSQSELSPMSKEKAGSDPNNMRDKDISLKAKETFFIVKCNNEKEFDTLRSSSKFFNASKSSLTKTNAADLLALEKDSENPEVGRGRGNSRGSINDRESRISRQAYRSMEPIQHHEENTERIIDIKKPRRAESAVQIDEVRKPYSTHSQEEKNLNNKYQTNGDSSSNSPKKSSKDNIHHSSQKSRGPPKSIKSDGLKSTITSLQKKIVQERTARKKLEHELEELKSVSMSFKSSTRR